MPWHQDVRTVRVIENGGRTGSLSHEKKPSVKLGKTSWHLPGQKRDIPTSKIPFCRQVGRSVAYPEMVQLRPDEMCGGKGGGGGRQSAGGAEKNNSVGFYQPQQNGEWEIKLFIITKLSFFIV